MEVGLVPGFRRALAVLSPVDATDTQQAPPPATPRDRYEPTPGSVPPAVSPKRGKAPPAWLAQTKVAAGALVAAGVAVALICTASGAGLAVVAGLSIGAGWLTAYLTDRGVRLATGADFPSPPARSTRRWHYVPTRRTTFGR